MQQNIISVELTANSFTANSGKEYIIYSSVSTGRFPILEKYIIELNNGVSPSAYRIELNDAIESVNSMKFVDAAVRLSNMRDGVARIENMVPHPVLMICSLFICTKDEDQSRWSDAEALDKISDWAGVDMAFFLTSAKRFLTRFLSGSSIDSLSTLVQAQEATKKEG